MTPAESGASSTAFPSRLWQAGRTGWQRFVGRFGPHITPLVALAAGAAYPLGFAPYDVWPLTVAAMAALYWSLRQAGARRPFLHGWLFGVGKYGVGVYWIYVSIEVYGNASPWLAGTLVGLFVAGMALFHGAAAWLFARLRGGGAVEALAFAAIWTLTEWVLTWFLTGFPWLFAGYAMLDTPLAALAPVGGVLLVSFAIAFTGAGLIRWRVWQAPALAALLWFAGVALSQAPWTKPGASKSVSIVQGVVAQETKWRPASQEPIRERYAALSESAWGSDLVVWPEAAITTPLHLAQPFLDDMAERASGSLVLGLMALERGTLGWAWYNAAVAVGDGDGRYIKRRMVPFGEYLPFGEALRGLIDFFNLPMSRLSPGDPEQPMLRTGDLYLAMSICYEIAFPELVREGAAQADVLATISNDTWFGTSIGPPQHLQIARMRALENGRFVLRATNDGITAIVDSQGNTVSTLPRFERGVLHGEFRPMRGVTPFGRWGSAPLVVGLVVFLVVLAVARPRLTARSPAAWA